MSVDCSRMEKQGLETNYYTMQFNPDFWEGTWLKDLCTLLKTEERLNI